MEKLSLETVLSAERQAAVVGMASAEELKQKAKKWLLEHELKLLAFDDGVAEAIDRITKQP